MSEIADDFKIVVVDAIRAMCLKFPQAASPRCFPTACFPTACFPLFCDALFFLPFIGFSPLLLCSHRTSCSAHCMVYPTLPYPTLPYHTIPFHTIPYYTIIITIP